MKSLIIGAAMMGTMAISVPSLAATGNTAGVATTAQLETQRPAMRQLLSSGSRGHWVMTLQADLNLLGVPSGPVNGEFGPRTEAAVKSFQDAHQLAVTGSANPPTWQDILAGFHLTPPVGTTSGISTTPATSKAGSQASSSTIDGRPIVHVYHMVATAYGPSLADNYPYGPVDAFGQPLAPGMIAVDPSVIPLKSTVYVQGYQDGYLPQGGFLGHAVDTGGAIQGMRIDIFMNNNSHVVANFGVQPVTVYVLGQ